MIRPTSPSGAVIFFFFSTLFLSVLNPSAWSASPWVPLDRNGVSGTPGDVELIKNGVFQHPLIYPAATTADGRIGLDRNDATIRLFNPEALGAAPIMNQASPNGSLIVTAANTHGISKEILIPTVTPTGGYALTAGPDALCDAPSKQNPSVCNGTDDCYDLYVIRSANYVDSAGTDHTQFWGQEISVEVSNPKTAQAAVKSITALGAAVLGADIPNALTIFEPVITSDGKFFLISMSTQAGKTISWLNNATGTTMASNYNIMYSYNSTGNACDVTQWKTFQPVSHAHYDKLFQPKAPSTDYLYKFAQFPIKDSEGYILPDGADVGGVYPWIDRGGTNLFFNAVSTNLLYVDSAGAAASQYPLACTLNASEEPYACVLPSAMTKTDVQDSNYEEIRDSRGLSMTGLWTHGKIVLLDNIFNNSDYGLFGPDDFHYQIQLYENGDGTPVSVPVGTARDGGGVHPVPGEPGVTQAWSKFTPAPPFGAGNTTITDSLTNLFNYHARQMKPNSVRDVAWIVNMGKASATVPFDDYIDPNALIYADMNASQSFPGSPYNPTTYGPTKLPVALYNNGFNSKTALSIPIHLQNAATAPMWNLPPFGTVATGDIRIEPVALGGKIGKGLWLDGNSGIQFSIPAQTTSLTSTPWYVSLWFDNRSTETNSRRLLTFPDKTYIAFNTSLTAPYLAFYNASGTQVEQISLVSPNGVNMISSGAKPGWTHLAFMIDNTLKTFPTPKVETYINGMHYYITQPAEPIFSLAGSNPIIVGAPSTTASGIHGWIDEFKVIARAPDYESICNYAGGSLVGMAAPTKTPPPSSTLQQATTTPLAYWQSVAANYSVNNGYFFSQITDQVKANAQINGVTTAPTTYPYYACYTDTLSDNGTDLNSLIAANGSTTSAHAGLFPMKNAIHFPEGPLVWNKPRPNSTANGFCLSCHQASQSISTLLPAVLEPASEYYGSKTSPYYNASLANVLMAQDPRRQPFQGPALMFGNIPAGLFGNGPAANTTAPSGGFSIDEYAFPSN